MFILAHMGIGGRTAQACNRSWSPGWLLLGALLPDLIDKPLYHAFGLTQVGHPDAGLISCTRTLGHSGLFVIALALAALVLRSRVFAALAAGALTHVSLDVLQDALTSPTWYPTSLQALFFPLVDGRFGTHHSVTDLRIILPAEVIGLVCLLSWRNLRRPIVTLFPRAAGTDRTGTPAPFPQDPRPRRSPAFPPSPRIPRAGPTG